MTTAAHKLLLMLSGNGLAYFLRDQFPNDASITNGDALACEPGPGTLTYAEVDGTIAKSGGRLTFTAQTTPAYGDLGFREAVGRARVAGRAFGLKFSIDAITGSVNMILLGWGFNNRPNSSSNVRYGFNHFNDSLILVTTPGGFITLEASALAANTEYRAVLILGTTGCDYWLQGGAYADWTRVWRNFDGSDATLYPCGAANNVAGYWDDVHGFDTVFPALDVDVLNPVSGAQQTAPLTGFFDMMISALPSPTAGASMELRFREQDANNYFMMQLLRNAGDTAWDVHIKKVTAGTPSTLASATGVGTPDTLRVCVREGNKIRMYTRTSTGAYTLRGSEVTDSAFSSSAAISANYSSGTVSQLTGLRRTDAQVSATLNRFLP
jgi:hypothetical protein